MPLSEFQIKLIEKEVGGLCHRRTPEHARDQLEYVYKLEKQDVLIFEVRPVFKDPDKKSEMPFAKIKFLKSRNLWKLYWQRANGSWLQYESPGESKDISTLVKAIDEDQHGCFFG
jgi:hypothetical protein